MRWITYSMAAVVTWCSLCGSVRAGNSPVDAAMARAEAYVEKSDRYLHHRHLKRGMKGYGLSVFAGTQIERFDVEIISVVRCFPGMPQRDVILAKLSGQGLETSHVVEGMSGSPVYVTDPRDGKDKIIGAVAFGWSLSTEPQCGLQPITQMLASAGIPREEPAASQPTTQSTTLPGGAPALPDSSATSQPTTKPATQPASQPANRSRLRDSSLADSTWENDSAAGGMSPRAFLDVALQPGKGSFDALAPLSRGKAAPGQLQPLAVPISVSGCDDRLLSRLEDELAPAGLRPVSAGALPGEAGFGGLNAKELEAVKLQPGSAISVALVTGDQDWTAVGTVTDVLDDTVIAFGHSMFSEGVVRLPMGTAYIHQIIPRLTTSFKLGSAIRNVGALTRDEEVAVSGVIGPKVSMIPMTVHVDQVEDNRSQTFHYNLVRQRYYTARLAAMMVDVSAYALRLPPVEHYVRYEVKIDFGPLGVYHAVNVTSDEEVYAVLSDTARPLAVLLNNPYGPAPRVKRIDVNMAIYKGSLSAKILDAKLNGTVYKPGQTVTGAVLIEPYRQKRQWIPIELTLPADLPDGEYPLTFGDMEFREEQLRREQPQDFAPRSVPDLFTALQKIVQPRSDRLYLHIPLQRPGLAVGMQKLPDLPRGKARTLQQAQLPDVRTIQSSFWQEKNIDYVLFGQARTTFTVKREINETLLRE